MLQRIKDVKSEEEFFDLMQRLETHLNDPWQVVVKKVGVEG
jgi:hypothetical protein